MQYTFNRDISFSLGDIVVWCSEHDRTELPYLILETPERLNNPEILSAVAFDLTKQRQTSFSIVANKNRLISGYWLKVIKSNTEKCEYFFSPNGCSRPFELYGRK